jgi:hypothetical protein
MAQLKRKGILWHQSKVSIPAHWNPIRINPKSWDHAPPNPMVESRQTILNIPPQTHILLPSPFPNFAMQTKSLNSAESHHIWRDSHEDGPVVPNPTAEEPHKQDCREWGGRPTRAAEERGDAAGAGMREEEEDGDAVEVAEEQIFFRFRWVFCFALFIWGTRWGRVNKFGAVRI